ncbi:HNH endonuclease, partial [Patescibacteria group bacterium]|nr:HNH endonuclease [Patescibacteria group bacterium]
MKNQIFPLMVGDVISHHQMSSLEGKNLQKGMHFGNSPTHSVLLMSVRPGAPYRDQVLEDGKVLIYEGHDLPMTQGVQNPKDFDQPFRHGSGLTQNGKFFEAAVGYKKGVRQPELVRVYEKVRSGIWVYNGMFR